MAYDIFTQIQGPVVPISLFGDAAKTGAALGKEIPTGLSSAIEGSIEGVKTGEDLLREQTQIDAEKQQTQNAQTVDQINQLKLQEAQATQDASIQATKAELTLKTRQATDADKDITNVNAITDRLSSGDPDKIKEIYSNPELHGILLKDPKLADSVAGEIYSNPNLTPDLKSQAIGSLNLSQQLKFKEFEDRTNAMRDKSLFSQYEEASKNFTGTHAAQVIQDVPENEVPSRVKTYPKGQVGVNSDGTINKDFTPNPDDLNKDGNKGLSSVFVDGKFKGDVREQEARQLEVYKNAIVGKQNTLARASGLYYQGWTYPASQKAQPDTQASGQSASSVPTFQSQDEQKQSLMTPSTGPTNSNIVDNARDEAIKAAQTPPKGMTYYSWQQKLANTKQRIQQATGPTPSQTLNQSSNSAAQVNQASTLAPAELPGFKRASPSSQGDVILGPSQTLSSLYKKNVVLNTEEQPILKSHVYDRINNDPLLAAESPLVKGLVALESGGVREAQSPTGVRGLMQVSKGTAAEMGLNRDIPEQNVLAGKLYLTKLLHQFNGDIRLSLAAYNAGPGTIKDAIRHTGVTDWPVVKDYLEEHLSPKKFAEVKNYPDKVISYASQFMTKGDAADQGMAYLLENNGLIKNANQQIADEMNI